MGAASPEYCRRTPLSKMGFTQRSSCKAQGIIPRTGKTNKGKKIVSPKYKKSRRPRKMRIASPKRTKNISLYSPGKNKPRVKTGFKDAETARMTIKNISKKDMTYQKQVVTTMYNRAKHHPYQTPAMREAMKVYRTWMKKHSVKF